LENKINLPSSLPLILISVSLMLLLRRTTCKIWQRQKGGHCTCCFG